MSARATVRLTPRQVLAVLLVTFALVAWTGYVIYSQAVSFATYAHVGHSAGF